MPPPCPPRARAGAIRWGGSDSGAPGPPVRGSGDLRCGQWPPLRPLPRTFRTQLRGESAARGARALAHLGWERPPPRARPFRCPLQPPGLSGVVCEPSPGGGPRGRPGYPGRAGPAPGRPGASAAESQGAGPARLWAPAPRVAESPRELQPTVFVTLKMHHPRPLLFHYEKSQRNHPAGSIRRRQPDSFLVLY